MSPDEIRKHWEIWAEQFGKNLRATTKTSTAKLLEIDALIRTFTRLGFAGEKRRILEVGCGNGHNCFALAEKFPNHSFTGMDYIPLMVTNALAIQEEKKSQNTSFVQGDLLNLSSNQNLGKDFDLVFTDRCLINLNSLDLQLKGLDQIIEKVRIGGYLVVIENIKNLHDTQNEIRSAVGLEPRKQAEYNVFIEEEPFLKRASERMTLEFSEDFISLHDLVLYVLVPMINGGKIDYEHPMVQAATQLSALLNLKFEKPFGAFGQNRLYQFKRIK